MVKRYMMKFLSIAKQKSIDEYFVRYLDFRVTALKTFLRKFQLYFQRKDDRVLAVMPINSIARSTQRIKRSILNLKVPQQSHPFYLLLFSHN